MSQGFSAPIEPFRVLPEPASPAGSVAATEDAELASVLHLADPGPLVLPPGRGAPTFLPNSTGGGGSPLLPGSEAWTGWLETSFERTLAPALVQAATSAGLDNARDLRSADLALARELPPDLLGRTREPGRRLLHRLQAARGVRWVERLQGWAVAGETPALFPTVFAGHCALFHLPLRTILLAYTACEWRAAQGMSLSSHPDDPLMEALAASRPAVERTLAHLMGGGHVLSPVRPARGV